MQLATKIAYNAIVQTVSKTIAVFLGLVAVAIITRYLGQEGFGQYTTIITFLSFFGIIADLGLTLVTVQMISKPGANQNKILSNLLALRLLSAVFFLSLAPIIILFFPYQSIIKIGVAIAVFSYFFTSLNQIFIGLFQKNLRLDKVSIAEVAGRVVLVIGCFLAYYLKLGLLGILGATVFSGATNFILLFIFSKNFAKISLKIDLPVWRQIISKSWPIAITIFFNLIYLKTGIILLSLLKRPSEIGLIAEVGVYGAAYKITDVIVTFPFMFAGIILPIITFYWANREKDKFFNVLQRSFNLLIIAAMPVVIGVQFTADLLMSLVAGKDFIVSAPILKLLIIATGLIFAANIFTHAVIAINKVSSLIKFYVFTAISSVVGYFILIPKYSYLGAAWVSVYSELVIALSAIYLIRKYTKFFPKLSIIAKTLAASLVMGLVINLLRDNNINNIIIIILVSGLIYFASLFALRGLTKKDFMILLNK